MKPPEGHRPPSPPDSGDPSRRVRRIGDRDIVFDVDDFFWDPNAWSEEATRILAREAVLLIEVDYEILPPVLDVEAAMKDDAPLLIEDLTTDYLGEPTGRNSNIAMHLQHIIGDPEEGFKQAEVVVEREFRTATVHQGYIEPQTATASWDAGNRVTIWTSTQGTFWARTQVSEELDLPVGAIKIIPLEVGGGFGGKIYVYLPSLAVLLSRKSGRPVQMTMNRTEDFQATGPTPGAYIRVRIGAAKDGKITAAQAMIAFEAGAFPGGVIGSGATCIFACYDLSNAQVDGYDVLVNKPKIGAYRATGSTQVAFAMESAKQHAHYQTPLEGPYRGRGVATGFFYNIGFKSTVIANVNEDGTVGLLIGSADLSGTRTTLAMQLAEALGVNPENVIPEVGNTDITGYTDIADVEVDPETGKITVLRFTGVLDAGRAVHPQFVEGQLRGGSVQGIGWALNEEYYYSLPMKPDRIMAALKRRSA